MKNLTVLKNTKEVAREVFCKKDVLNNLAKFTRKHLCWNLSFRPEASNFIKI